MASELVPLDEAAQLLKISPQQLSEMVSRKEIFPLRGSSPPKFKMDELQRVADERGISLAAAQDFSFMDETIQIDAGEVDLDQEKGEGPSSSILVSEQELGGSQSPSSTVIGDDEEGGDVRGDSDLVLGSEGDEMSRGSSLRLDALSDDEDSGSIKLADVSDLPLKTGSKTQAPAPPQAKAQAQAKALSDLHLSVEKGAPQKGAAGSDVEPTDSDLEKMGGSDLELTGDSDIDLGAEVMAGAGESDLLLAGASDVGPGDTGKLDAKAKKSDLEFATDDLEVSMADSGSALDLGDDDELVLEGESALDDIALAGDSGINLAKPSDSGIDLAMAEESGIKVAGDSGFMLEDEDALQLEGGSSSDNLALPEESAVSLDADLADPDAATQLKSDEDFDLTPVEGAVDDESDSGSQVIALDTEALDADAPTQLGGLALGPVDMEPVESVITEEPAEGFAPGVHPGAAAVAQQPQFPVQELPETPYSIWQVGSLAIVALMLMFTGILMIDVMRNIWSFDQPYGLSTSIMNSIVEALGI
jgi:hypothetical protein